MKITTPMVLGVITIVELVITHRLEGSIELWLCYGVYKLLLSK